MAGIKNTPSVITSVVKGAVAIGGAALLVNELRTLYSKKAVNNYDLMFPNDLIVSGGRNFYMTFEFVQYKRQSIFEPIVITSSNGIRLPIPSNLVDTQTITYDQADSSNNPAIGAGIEQLAKGNGISGSNVVEALKDGAVAGVLNAAIEKAKSANINPNQILQLAGVAQNPFLTVLFQAPTFKHHQFQWKFSPKDIDETNTIRAIATQFKKNSLPSLNGAPGGTLLNYPNMVNMAFQPANSYLYQFKPAVIESVSLNYAPGATPAFFKNSSAPTEITLSLSLLETEYWLQEDFNNLTL